jgi:hypothetical protein
VRLRSRTAALALAMAAFAVGAAQARTVHDGRGDANGFSYNDLRSASATERGGLLVHTISVYGELPPGFAGPRLYIDTSGRPGPEYIVARLPDGRTAVRTARRGRRVARATWRQVNATTIRLSFRPRAIGSPRRYRWRAFTESVNEQTPPQELDSLPNHGWVVQRVR